MSTGGKEKKHDKKTIKGKSDAVGNGETLEKEKGGIRHEDDPLFRLQYHLDALPAQCGRSADQFYPVAKVRA